MNPEKIYSIIREHVPSAAMPYCYQLWQETPFDLKITRTRQTKVGDFTSKRSIAHPRITLNHELNPFLFLITYIHEVAHLRVHLHHGNRVDPHGEEWKKNFQLLMQPVLNQNIFAGDVLVELHRHMANPKASSFADTALTKVLRSYDKDAAHYATLSDIPEGSIFRFQGRFFKKGKIRRTRVLCHEVKTKRHYLVPADVLVSGVQLSLL
ncbi:MAG TPA: transcription elongation protein SprT [Chryseosolibacter sp.]|nr:transcription elongation protein SprT [Chryseosolibacter sp.]